MNGHEAKEEEPLAVANNTGLVKLAIFLGVGVGIFILQRYVTTGGHPLNQLHVLREGWKHHGPGGALVFLLAGTCLIFAGMPRLFFFGLGGALMGFGGGCAVALLASVMGSYLSFVLLRWCGRDWTSWFFRKTRSAARLLEFRPTVVSVFMIRQLPLSTLVLNAALALSRVSTGAFLLGSLLGFVPQGVVAALIGSGTFRSTTSSGVAQLAWAAFVILILGVWAYARKYMKLPGNAGAEENP